MDLLLTLAKQFKINESFFIMLGIFVVAYWALRSVGLKKLSESLVERDRRIEGRRLEAQELGAESEQIGSQLQSAMNQARADASKLFADFRLRAQQEQRQILNLAREKAGTLIKGANRDAANQLGLEAPKVKAESDRLALLVLDQLLVGGPKENPARTGAESGL
jgi:F0F1-type ATP synthase membrane subunit b/b'